MALFGLAVAAQARVYVHINLSTQRMTVQSSSGSYNWAVSTARSGYSTPRGSYSPKRLEAMHYSKKYHMSPMPHSIFFRGGYAIHGTYSVSQLGRPASHGCIRLAPGNAAALYQMVKAEGARISISGSPPASRYYAARKHRTHYASAHRHRSHGHHYYASRRVTQHPLAYAPGYFRSHRATVRGWQRNPLGYDPWRY
ncbi:MAG: L,D-transpeptidase [Hyphomicrobiales bacterium]|nr:L,D-transpeptidase [Hyphomicrobiales bacterium]